MLMDMDMMDEMGLGIVLVVFGVLCLLQIPWYFFPLCITFFQ